MFLCSKAPTEGGVVQHNPPLTLLNTWTQLLLQTDSLMQLPGPLAISLNFERSVQLMVIEIKTSLQRFL